MTPTRPTRRDNLVGVMDPSCSARRRVQSLSRSRSVG